MVRAIHPRRAAIFALFFGAALLSSCRNTPPVVRHFLRMPAEYAGGLSSIQRAQWLKASRRNLPPRKVLAATGHLSLSGTSTKRGRILLGLEMLHVPAEGGNGGLAVVVIPGENADAPPRLHLLEHQRFVYRLSGLQPAMRDSWRIDAAGKTVTGFNRRGAGLTPAAEVRWTGQSWTGR